VRTRLFALLLAAGLAGGAAAPPAHGCVACEAPPAAEVQALYSEADWSRMREGEVLSELVKSDGEEGSRARASGIVPSRPEAIWAVLTDWESYPSFMPNIEETKLRRREGDRAWISQHLSVMWNAIRYGVVWDMKPREGHVRFALDETQPSDLAALDGSWQLVPLRDGGGTLLRYESFTDVGRAVPAFIRDALSKRSLPAVMRAVREEVARRPGATPE
jgi:ribosome-associated toxin RatA of RatAB toxin-antitoxin module